MNLEIKTSQKGDVTVVTLGGRLILGEASNRLRDCVCELIQKGHNNIRVNLKNVSYIDSGGLGQLVGCYATVTQRGGELKLTALSERAAELLELTQLSTVLDVVEESDDSSDFARCEATQFQFAH